MLAFKVTEGIGLWLIFLLVMLETGCGVAFSPGEIAVVSGGIEAADHKLALLSVILVAAAGAIVGDNIGYVIGRLGGRRLLEKGGPLAKQRRKALEVADPFFAKHGAKTVFYGRWLPGMRVFTSWIAGGTKMQWRLFVLWNAFGGITWALTMTLLGYWLGATAKTLISGIGTVGLILIIISVIVAVVVHKRHQRRVLDRLSAEAAGNVPVATPAQATVAHPVTAAAGQATVATPVVSPPAGQATVIRPRKAPGDPPAREG